MSPIYEECDAASPFRCRIVQRRNVKKRSEGSRSYNCREIEHSVAPRRSINPPRLRKRQRRTLMPSIVGNDRRFLNTSSLNGTNSGCPVPSFVIFVSWDSFLGKISFVFDCLFFYKILSRFADRKSIVTAGISSSNNVSMHFLDALFELQSDYRR